MKLIWMSDLHYSGTGTVLGMNAERHLRAVIGHVAKHHADAGACIITGDLAENGIESEYRALRRHFDDLDMPVLPLTGNHDRRAALRAAFDIPGDAMPDFVQYEHIFEPCVLLALDTLVEGHDHGELCARRLSWLRDRLRVHRDRRVLIAMHHPPVSLGMPMLDPDNLRNGSTFLDLLAAHGDVEHILCGHVHRLTHSVARGMALTSLRSVLYQAPPPKPDWDWSGFSPADEPPGLAVVLLGEDGTTIQHEQFAV